MERATRLKPLPVKVHEAQKTVDELSKQGHKEAERRFLARLPTGTFAIMAPSFLTSRLQFSQRAFSYFALEALIDKPPLAPIRLLAHASCLGELEARIVGCLCCARAPAARNTHLCRLCGKARESGHRTNGQHCYLDDLLHLDLRYLSGCVSVAPNAPTL